MYAPSTTTLDQQKHEKRAAKNHGSCSSSMCDKTALQRSTVVLTRCPGLQIVRKHHILVIFKVFHVKIKLVIQQWSFLLIMNHTVVAVSVTTNAMGFFPPALCHPTCYLLKKGSVLKKTEKEERQIDRQAHRDTDKCSGSIIGTRAEERRKKIIKKTENSAQGFPAFQPVSL